MVRVSRVSSLSRTLRVKLAAAAGPPHLELQGDHPAGVHPGDARLQHQELPGDRRLVHLFMS